MLVIRKIERSGHEEVLTCKTANFDPAVGQNNEHPNGILFLTGCPMDGDQNGPADPGGTRHITSGNVFVMSIEGRTVAKYDLC